ncbi:hypothetical protein KY329_00060 [Candidatus Woesearchaeota archaeon]|nr:hypothetical protein [Candidatus Woesearchaeota archaeon]
MSGLRLCLFTDRRGSNPGAGFSMGDESEPDSYLKYCDSSALRGVPLVSGNQPLYESLTFRLAEKFGLRIPDCGVIDNRGKTTEFEYRPEFKGKKLNPQKEFYHLSRIIPGEQLSDEKAIDAMLKQEGLYLALLGISDIYGRRQNYFVPVGNPCIVYLDLGCSFVDCRDGRITQRNMFKKHNNRLNSKELRNALRKLKRTRVMTNVGEELGLNDFVESIGDGLIPTQHGNMPFSDLVSMMEIDYITELYTLHLAEAVAKHKSDERIF